MNKTIVTITGNTFNEALDKVKRLYGEKAQIISQREVQEGGVFGIGARKIIELEVWLQPIASYQPAKPSQDNKRDLIEAAKIVQQVKKEGEQIEMLKNILDEVNDLKQQVQQQHLKQGAIAQQMHPMLQHIYDILVEQNDFSQTFALNIINEIKNDFSVNELEQLSLIEEVTLKEIAKQLVFYTEIPRGKPRIIILVGPTGVGKTTTLAKLAAQNLVSSKQNLDIRLINLDSFRIGAKEQIEAYGDILQTPVTTIYSANDLKEAIDASKHADLIFVDTIGKSPQETVKLAEMQQLIDAFGRSTEVHLALSSTNKESDVRDILANFELFRYHAVILTKVDETVRLGAALSALIERRKAISYLTIGQNVPRDIEKANISSIWKRLSGFSRATVDKLLEQQELNGGW
jgi:flagellar biosynthesis protein FlhF